MCRALLRIFRTFCSCIVGAFLASFTPVQQQTRPFHAALAAAVGAFLTGFTANSNPLTATGAKPFPAAGNNFQIEDQRSKQL
jgi:uncharacterized membrane protein YccC